jgi:hypothetical protein
VPVVTISLGVEASGLRDRKEILVADEPGDFVRAVVELYESEQLWNRTSENGFDRTRAWYSTDSARAKLEFLFNDAHMKAQSCRRRLQSPSLS